MKQLIYLSILCCPFLISSISVYAESEFTFRGEIIDHNTQEGIQAGIFFYSEGRLVEAFLSDKKGYFEFVTTELIDTIEIQYMGSILMKIVEIEGARGYQFIKFTDLINCEQ